MRRFLSICTILLLASCHSIPKHYEDEKVYVIDHKVYIRHSDKLTEEELKQVKKDYTEPYLDENEERALKGRGVADALDVATTVVGLNIGCVEKNPLLGTNPSVGVIVAVKGLGYWMTYSHAKASPKMFSSAKQLKNDNYILFGVVAWNLYQISQGCIG